MFGRGRNPKPLPPWFGILAGLWFCALGGFFVFALIVGEPAPGVSVLVFMIAVLFAACVFAVGLSLLITSARRLL